MRFLHVLIFLTVICTLTACDNFLTRQKNSTITGAPTPDEVEEAGGVNLKIETAAGVFGEAIGEPLDNTGYIGNCAGQPLLALNIIGKRLFILTGGLAPVDCRACNIVIECNPGEELELSSYSTSVETFPNTDPYLLPSPGSLALVPDAVMETIVCPSSGRFVQTLTTLNILPEDFPSVTRIKLGKVEVFKLGELVDSEFMYCTNGSVTP